MRDFTMGRAATSIDEMWSCEHHAVYTQGQAGKAEHILAPSDIPIVQSDRGGQVTYHAPGQLIIYVMLDLKRLKLTVRSLVCALEQSVIDTLSTYNVDAYAKREAPGVYVNDAKICSLGLRIKRGYSYHGLALNIDLELSPFDNINPCGFKSLPITRLKDLVDKEVSVATTQRQLIDCLASQFAFTINESNKNNLGAAA